MTFINEFTNPCSSKPSYAENRIWPSSQDLCTRQKLRVHPKNFKACFVPFLSLLRCPLSHYSHYATHECVHLHLRIWEYRYLCVLSCTYGHVSAQKWLSVHRGDVLFPQRCSQHMNDLSSQSSEQRECEDNRNCLEVSLLVRLLT